MWLELLLTEALDDVVQLEILPEYFANWYFKVKIWVTMVAYEAHLATFISRLKKSLKAKSTNTSGSVSVFPTNTTLFGIFYFLMYSTDTGSWLNYHKISVCPWPVNFVLKPWVARKLKITPVLCTTVSFVFDQLMYVLITRVFNVLRIISQSFETGKIIGSPILRSESICPYMNYMYMV